MKVNKQILYSLLTNITNFGVPIITIPYVISSLGLEMYGYVISLNLIVLIFVGVINSGLTSLSIKDYVNNKNNLGKILTRQLLYALIGTALVVSYMIYYAEAEVEYVLILSLAVLSTSLNVEWFFYATSKIKFLFIRTVFVKISFLILVLCFVKKPDDYFIYLLLLCLSIIFIALSSFLYLIFSNEKEAKIRLFDVITFKYFTEPKYFFANGFIGVSYRYVDQMIVGMILGHSELGIYNVLKQILNAVLSVPTSLFKVTMKQAISKIRSDKKYREYIGKYLKYGTLLILPLSFLLYALVDFVLLNYVDYSGLEFASIVIPVNVIILTYVMFIDTHYLVPNHLEKFLTYSNLLVSVISLVGIYYVIPHIGANSVGAIGVVTLGEFLGLCIILFLMVRKVNEQK